MQDITGQVAVITGASRGIGHASAIALAKEGVNIVATARSADQLDELVSECKALGVEAISIAGDAAKEEDARKVYAAAMDSFGKVDILVNNVGVANYVDLVDTTLEDYDWMMSTNMRSTFLFSKLFVPGMIEQKSGSVIFVSSQAGVAGFPGEAVYCATKHAQVGFARALDGELRPHNVKVSILEPGGVSTTFAFGTGREPGMPALDTMSEAETVAAGVVFAATVPPKSRILYIGMRPMAEPLYGGA